MAIWTETQTIVFISRLNQINFCHCARHILLVAEKNCIWFNAFLTLSTVRLPRLRCAPAEWWPHLCFIFAFNPGFQRFLSRFVYIYHYATLIFYWCISFLPCEKKRVNKICCRTFQMNIIIIFLSRFHFEKCTNRKGAYAARLLSYAWVWCGCGGK